MSERRALLAGAVAVAAAAWARRASATDYASAAEALDAIEAEAGRVRAHLQALRELPPARPFAESLLREHERQAGERARLRQRLGLPPATGGTAEAAGRSLAELRAAQEALVFAHAEGLPALPDPPAVDQLGRDLVVASRHLTLIDLWIESEAARD